MENMNTEEKIALAYQKIQEADAILLGAGAGLSTAAGLIYDGQDFQNNFGDFIAKYHFPNLYYGGFGPFASIEEQWAYWSRFISLERYRPGPLPLYQKLLQLFDGKDYFVLTTNVDHCFQKAGCPKDRLFYTQGDYGLFQCSVPCHQSTYDNQRAVEAMLKEQKDMQIPSSLIPKCPVCGKPMSMNLRADNTFVEDKGWHEAEDRYDLFLANHYESGKIVYLELGVGENTPAIIHYPFVRLCSENPEATFISVNLRPDNVPLALEKQAIVIADDLKEVIEKWAAFGKGR
jgi:NAD-dependent SIR2 family protein deacetylase